MRTYILILHTHARTPLLFTLVWRTGFLKPGANGGVLDQELTYAALDVHTNRVAALLLRNGVAPGDRVVLVYPPSLDFMLAFLSCLKAGVIAVPVFPPNPLRRDSLHMFAKIVAGCGARVALTNRSYQHTKKLAGIQERLRMGRRATAWPDDLEWILTDRQAMATSTTTTTPLVMPVASDVAFLQYTSGTLPILSCSLFLWITTTSLIHISFHPRSPRSTHHSPNPQYNTQVRRVTPRASLSPTAIWVITCPSLPTT